MMKAGALFSILALVAITNAQEPTTLRATSFLTERDVTIVTFTTDNRAEFYELLHRIGKSDEWEYTVGWKPHFRLSVYVLPSTEISEPPTSLQRVLTALKLETSEEDGWPKIAFVGERALFELPLAMQSSDRLTVKVENIPSLTVVALATEARKLDYRVKNIKSTNVPKLNMQSVGFDQFLKLFSRSAKLKVQTYEKFLMVTKR